MNWLLARMKEASSHVSLAVILQCVALIDPAHAMIWQGISTVFGATGFAIPEQKTE